MNILEVKTKDFQEDRCSILLADMQYTHDVIIPQYIVNDIDMHIQLGNVTKKYKMAENGQEILDYDAMHNDLYGQRGGDLYNLAIGILKEKMGIKSDTKADTHRPKELPEELSTHEAKEWLDYCVEKGLLDKDYQPTGKVYTEALKAYLAEKLNEAIFPNQKIHKWKPFETLWGCKGFTKKRYTSREQVGIVRDGEYIDKCFPNKIIEKGKHRK